MWTRDETEFVDDVMEKWIAAIMRDDDVSARRLLGSNSECPERHRLLETHLNFPRHNITQLKLKRQLSATNFSPDTAWCLAALCDSRKVMNVLQEYDANVLQVNSTGNNLLHVLSALASTSSEEKEEEVIMTLRHIQDMLNPVVYHKLLLAENADGLRPLELASHLGAFGVFMFFFNTPGIYITKEDDHILYKVQYFDITEYIVGSRIYQSPIYAMTYLEESKISNKSVNRIYLSDPMRSWLKAIFYVNVPLIVIWAFLRTVYIYLFLECDLTIVPVCTDNATCQHNNVNSVATNLVFYWSIFCMSLFTISVDISEFVVHLISSPHWLNHVVYRRKRRGMRQNFYRIAHFVAVLSVVVFIGEELIKYYLDSHYNRGAGYGVVAAVYGFVWSVLYFCQLLPMIGHYVMAVQRMLRDFASFSFLLVLFFVTYSMGFYKLLRASNAFPEFTTFPRSLYGTFEVMLNMVNFFVIEDVSPGVLVLHITFVFMITILLLNFLIATLSSSYEHVMTYRDIFIQLQIIAVTMTTDYRFRKFLPSLRNRLLRRYFVHENGHYFITCVVDMRRRHGSCHSTPHEQT